MIYILVILKVENSNVQMIYGSIYVQMIHISIYVQMIYISIFPNDFLLSF
jgi:hypothetical protein